jgi:hypothetical protein
MGAASLNIPVFMSLSSYHFGDGSRDAAGELGFILLGSIRQRLPMEKVLAPSA